MEIDLVIVDLYFFEEMVANIDDEVVIIEKIDIGGILLIWVVVKNYKDVVVVFFKVEYGMLEKLFKEKDGVMELFDCKVLALCFFGVFFYYDMVIFNYFN